MAKLPRASMGSLLFPPSAAQNLPQRPYLYWEFHEAGFSQAVRLGKWKGVRRKNRQAPMELYDVTSDVGETGMSRRLIRTL